MASFRPRLNMRSWREGRITHQIGRDGLSLRGGRKHGRMRLEKAGYLGEILDLIYWGQSRGFGSRRMFRNFSKVLETFNLVF